MEGFFRYLKLSDSRPLSKVQIVCLVSMARRLVADSVRQNASFQSKGIEAFVRRV
jgi:hypothetical protein